MKNLFDLLTPSELKHAILLFGMILVMAFMDVLGVASILPFVAVLIKPEVVHTNAILSAIFARSYHIGVYTTEQFLFALGVLVFVLLVTSLVFKALTTYVQAHFLEMCEYSLAKRLLEGYLGQPYSWFLSRHSADSAKTILSEVGTAIGYGMFPIVTLITQSTVAVALLILLFMVDPLVVLITFVSLGSAYLGIFSALSSWLKRLGQVRVVVNQERFKAVTEAFGAAKELKFTGLEEVYVQRFTKPAKIYAKVQTMFSVTSQLPRFTMEAITFGGMLLIILYFMSAKGDFASALPIVSLYALAGYRLMPALQQIYVASTQLRFAGASLDTLHKDLCGLQAIDVPRGNVNPLMLTDAITLNEVRYSYPNSRCEALKGIKLAIPVHSTVGFVGATGSGKTTTVDIILGLLEPNEGYVSIDGQPITAANRRQWQRAIGYVPQQIFLTDDSVAANIALGVDSEDIDHRMVERAAKIANLHEFVLNDLPEGYATAVGERGVRLSGGQRQRIGIARALYHNPQVLILDEATSALDSLTEQAVMEAVQSLEHKITIIMIAHRLSTVRQCDQIYLLERGEVKASGTYDQLKVGCQQFAAMARLDEDK